MNINKNGADIEKSKKSKTALKPQDNTSISECNLTWATLSDIMQDTLGVSIQGYGLDGTIFYWNKASEKIFGYKAEEVIGKKVAELVVPDELRKKFEGDLEVAAKTDKSGQFVPSGEFNLKTKKGDLVPVHSTHTMVNIEGREPLLFRIDIDLTERKKIEKQLTEAIHIAEKAQEELGAANKKLEKSAEKVNNRAQEAMVNDLTKSQFLASMSHEIRTPLNAIIGLSEVLTEERLNDEQKNYLSMIRESAQNMLVLINDILDFSKIHAGNFDINVMESSVEHLLAVIESLMRPQAFEKSLEFRVNQITDLPTKIQTDPIRVRQCILNLINFALSLTEKGHIYVNVALEEKDGQDFIKFEIEDTSDGIDDVRLRNIFDRLNSENLTDSNSDSTGLGLAITKKIAGLLGGDIIAKSQIGTGSKFSLFVPTGVEAENQPTFSKYDRMDKIRKDTEESELAEETITGKVLIAEDTPTNQTLIQLLLEKIGLDVTIVEDGLQAVKAVRNGDYDLILMDIQMPNMNGYEATRTLRSEGFTKPIIAVTAHAMKGDREKCLESGCDDYISKPIDRDELVKVLKLHLPVLKSDINSQVKDVNSQIQELTDMCKENDDQIEYSIDDYAEEGRDCPIDWHELTEMCEDEDVINQVVEMFLNDSPRCIGSLAEAIKDLNPKHIKMYAHSLKGASSQIGGKKLAEVAYRLECAGRDKELEKVPELFSQLQDEYGKLSVFLSEPDWMQKVKRQNTADSA